MNTPPRRDEQHEGCIDWQAYEARTRREMLDRSPLLVYEAIAQHYVDCAAYAVQLMRLAEILRHANPDGDEAAKVKWAMQYHAQEIRALHLKTFGVQPAWAVLLPT